MVALLTVIVVVGLAGGLVLALVIGGARLPKGGRSQRAVYAVVVIAVFLGGAATRATPAAAGTGNAVDESAKPLSIAVVGDVPYGAEQEAAFGDLISAINEDPKVRAALHVGDIKSGSSLCSDERLAFVASAFATFEDPLVYTPGDNEWTDCHRANNGGYDPLERLAAVRAAFFPTPGETLGRHPMSVAYQPVVTENVRWIESRSAIATIHVVGSNNGLAPWTGLGNVAPTAAQVADVDSRVAAALDWVDETFDAAEERDLRGVVLAMQADTWDPSPGSAQQAVVDRIAERASHFDGRVLLLQGDSHTYKADQPFTQLDNVTRVVVHGATLPFEYLRLTIDPRSTGLFSWERVPVGS